MPKRTLALAAGLWLVLAATVALAADPARDYGGPLTVGPNFQKGGQHGPPVYGTKPSKERTAPKVAKPKAPAAKVVRTEKPVRKAKPSSTAKKEDKENTTTSGTPTDDAEVSGANETAATTPIECKKFDATSGQTITVPCE